MRRIEKRLFAINDQLTRIRHERERLEVELDQHRAIRDRAERDAVAGHADDRVFLRDITGDAERFESALEKLEAEQERLMRKRAKLLDRL